MNVPIEYDDAVERKRTDPRLLGKLPTSKPPPIPGVSSKFDSVKPSTTAGHPRRSVLEDTTNRENKGILTAVGKDRKRVRQGRGRGRGRRKELVPGLVSGKDTALGS